VPSTNQDSIPWTANPDQAKVCIFGISLVNDEIFWGDQPCGEWLGASENLIAPVKLSPLLEILRRRC